MKKSALLVLLAIIVCGCQPRRPRPINANLPINKSSKMQTYLENKGIPTILSVGQWDNSYGPGLKISTRHYNIFTTLLDPLILSQVPGFMESCYQSYQNQLPAPVSTKTKFTIYIFETRGQWEEFTKRFVPLQAHVYNKIKSGAYYLNGKCVTYNIGREKTFSVLAHEGWHQFNHRHFKYRLPSWLDEGIAMQFEAFEEKDGAFYFNPAKNIQRLAGLKKVLAKGKGIPLEILISINPGEVIAANSDNAVIAFYGEAYALVRFLREEGCGKRLSSYKKMLNDGLTGNWPLKGAAKFAASDQRINMTVGWNRTIGRYIFKQYIGSDFEALQEEYSYFCRKIIYHVH